MGSADALAGVLTALKDAGIGLAAVNVSKPTLDEVFFALTGSAPATARGEKEGMENA
jgi:ABC-2 type transport system ATP-binding protein